MYASRVKLSHLTSLSLTGRCVAIAGSRKLQHCTRKSVLLNHRNRLFVLQQQSRGYSLIIRGIQGVLKLRYLLLGSALGGGYQISKKYEEFKENLPDFPKLPSLEWIESYLKELKVDESTRNVILEKYSELKNSTKDGEWLTNLSNNVVDKIDLINQWIDEAKQAQVGSQDTDPNDDGFNLKDKLVAPIVRNKEQQQGGGNEKYDPNNDLHEKLIKTQLKYQKQNDRLEREIRELKHQLLLLKQQKGVLKKSRGVRKPLIDMYSDVLDEITAFDNTLNTKDFLPRVVVVGDQSAGKTSVLEMIAGARIFPRGSGEMMTRSPVKVTLSEGPYQIAKFSDSSREYDLTNQNDLQELRNEIERRMKLCVKRGESVSKDVISLSVQGPGLQRMVLVDLPGIISTVTTEMSADTKDAISDITNHYMNNPNAIILCIQDGSVDVEKSLVTDLVSKVDPNGKRTIFVLTKLDLAEQSLTNPSRIKKILDGKLFPMKALGYFGVVTGKGVKNESIDSIKSYEEDFFKNSKLIKNNLLNIAQCTTQNLSMAVSDCFWKMVKTSVVQQADSFKALRFNLETEWRNKFASFREMTRDDLFDKGKTDILDQVSKLSCHKSSYWDELFDKQFWTLFTDQLFENVYFSSHSVDSDQTKTLVEISLLEWAKTLPEISVKIAKETFLGEFEKFLFNKSDKDYDDIYDELKKYVLDELKKNKYEWESRAINSLKVLQANAIENHAISKVADWNTATNTVQKLFEKKLNEINEEIRKQVGPAFVERWTRWKSCTTEERTMAAIKTEVERLIKPKELNINLDKATLEHIQANLQLLQIEANEASVKKMWSYMTKKLLLEQSCQNIINCKKAFYYYQQGYKDINYDDLITFWRIKKTISATVEALRNQLMNRESKRLEREIKEVLDTSCTNEDLKCALFKSKRATLAEELKRVRLIQEQLDDFIDALNKE